MVIKFIVPKLSNTCYAIRCMKHYSITKTLRQYIFPFNCGVWVTQQILIRIFSYKRKL